LCLFVCWSPRRERERGQSQKAVFQARLALCMHFEALAEALDRFLRNLRFGEFSSTGSKGRLHGLVKVNIR